MSAYDLLLRSATLVDPVHGLHDRRDLAVLDGKVAEVAEEIDRDHAKRTIDLEGLVLVPGIIDTHVHVCRPFGGTHGYRMMARVGVTTAIDLAGFPDRIVEGIRHDGCGLTVGTVYPIIPGETVDGRDPDEATLDGIVDGALREGALGIKVLGGHYPLTPEATAAAIRVASEHGAHVAVHAGTTATGSNVDGVRELLELAGGRRVHLAHVNSYCRGQITGDPVEEAAIALQALAGAENVVSESYLGLINGAVATCEGGVPTSDVVKTCLAFGGYAATLEGLQEAVRRGWGLVNRVVDGETRLLPPEQGLQHLTESGTRVGISFPVNSPGAAIAIATSRTERFRGPFTVDAISTDGGAFPRNTIVSQGLPLVHFGALTIDDFVIKTSVNPARMFGLAGKGHLGVGADGDVTVLDLPAMRPVYSVARGQVILDDGSVEGKGGCLLVPEAAGARLQTIARDVPTAVARIPT